MTAKLALRLMDVKPWPLSLFHTHSTHRLNSFAADLWSEIRLSVVESAAGFMIVEVPPYHIKYES